MAIHTEADIARLIRGDEWMMETLRAAHALNLPDWWIGAGFLRNKVWDAVSTKEATTSIHHGTDAAEHPASSSSPNTDSVSVSTPTRDVDLVYFNKENVAPEVDWAYDEEMKAKYPFAEWEVRNQARMHYVNDFAPYASAAEGISYWIETATCVAVKLVEKSPETYNADLAANTTVADGEDTCNGKLLQFEFLFCHGVEDLLGLVARPTVRFREGKLLELFHQRVEKKQWRERWPQLVVEES